jgi:hypothetical protein
MSRKSYIPFLMLLLALMLVVGAGTAAAQDPTPRHSDAQWQASYWSNPTLSGAATVSRLEGDLNFNWGTGSPDGAIPSDNFSARWSKYIDATAGNYRFKATSDDGIRVYVDNRLIIDRWYDHSAQTFEADVYLSAGHHYVVVEYYERGGDAVARLTFEPLTVIHAWRGEYYANKTLSGEPTLVRDDANIDFAWGSFAPANGLPADNFSVRWTRTLNLTAGRYRFTTISDDGVRLWVNNHLLIDQWHDQAATTYSGELWVSGSVPVKLEYYDTRDTARISLSWQAVGQSSPPPAPPPQPGGGIVVDDADPGFVTGGSGTGWRTAAEGYNGQLHWTKNNDKVRYNYNWARWYPQLSAGRYEVYVYIPDRYTTTGNARYWVSHRDGYTLRVVDQSAYGGQWVSLGTYWFRGSGQDYVSLADVTFEQYLTRLIAFDAMMWQRR